MEDLLTAPFWTRLNLYFVAAWGVLALYWLGRIAFAARRRQRPATTLWAIPGLLLLPLAPLLEVPVLFGLGAALLLWAEWWPQAFVPAPATGRPAWPWGLVLAALGAATLLISPATFLSALSGTALALGGLAWMLSGLLWPRPRQSQTWLPPSAMNKVHPPTFGTEVRWQPAQVPIPPELEVTVGNGYVLLHNAGGKRLWLRGWSPASRNAFLALDRTLDPGNEHRLSRDLGQAGVRVWYSPAGGSEVRLLRADWAEHGESRILH